MEETKIIYEPTYAPDTDITFIMKYVERVSDDALLEMSVLTFYCGEPDEETTDFYIKDALSDPENATKATYEP